MLNSTEVNLGQLLMWAGLTLGVLLTAAGDTMGHMLVAHLGLIVVGLSCTHAIRRAVGAREDALHNAFMIGRDSAGSSREPLRTLR